MAWSLNGSAKNDGMPLAHFTVINNIRAAHSYTFSSNTFGEIVSEVPISYLYSTEN